jgi:poly(3-hydroxybutyrate) depolymerase
MIPCNPGRPKIPITEVHGYYDTTIPYGDGARNGAYLPSIPYWAQGWALRDGLAATDVTTNLTSDTLVYTSGKRSENGLVTQAIHFKLGHDWPSIVQVGNRELASFHYSNYYRFLYAESTCGSKHDLGDWKLDGPVCFF